MKSNYIDISIGVPFIIESTYGVEFEVMRFDENTWGWRNPVYNDRWKVCDNSQWDRFINGNGFKIIDFFEEELFEEEYEFKNIQFVVIIDNSSPQEQADQVCKQLCLDILNGHSPGCSYYRG